MLLRQPDMRGVRANVPDKTRDFVMEGREGRASEARPDELVAERNRYQRTRKRKLITEALESKESGSAAVTRESELTAASEPRSELENTGKDGTVLNEPTQQCSSTVTKKQKKSSGQKGKLIPKPKRLSLATELGKIEPSILVEEIKGSLSSQFLDNRGLGGFVASLCGSVEPLYSIATHHRDDFARLYVDCNKSSVQFQLKWYAHCSAFLLAEDLTLDAIGFDESDKYYSSLISTRRTWIKFCKDHTTTVSDSKPVMMAISSAVYNYLLGQVSIYQESLTDQTPNRELSAQSSDGDDVYYRFGGGALCEMLKNRYKEIKDCPSTRRNLLSIEISMLQAMNNKDKSTIPAYLNYRDRGYMYFPRSSFILFLRHLDTLIKTVVNDEGFKKHGDELIKVQYTLSTCLFVVKILFLVIYVYVLFQVTHAELKKADSLKDEFTTTLKSHLPAIAMDLESEEAIVRIYNEFSRKICNARVQEYLSATKQEFAAKKGLASTVDTNLRVKLLTQHINLSSIRKDD